MFLRALASIFVWCIVALMRAFLTQDQTSFLIRNGKSTGASGENRPPARKPAPKRASHPHHGFTPGEEGEPTISKNLNPLTFLVRTSKNDMQALPPVQKASPASKTGSPIMMEPTFCPFFVNQFRQPCSSPLCNQITQQPWQIQQPNNNSFFPLLIAK